MWFLDQFQPGLPIYNIPLTILFPGPLNISALKQSLHEIVRRHETLRTTFQVIKGQPVQVIAPPAALEMPVLELREMPETMREAEVQRLAAKEAQHVFDLARGPLFRVTLVRVADADHRLLLNMHHIISDGWSVGVLLRELTVLYDAYASGRKSPLEELPLQYAEYARQQREYLSGERLKEQLSYWREQLAGAPPLLEMPTDRARPVVQTFRGAGRIFAVSAAVAERLAALSKAEGVTLFMTLLAAFKTLLYRYTGQADLVVGTPIANRNRADIEGLIGFFVNTLVLRTQLSGQMSFVEVVRQVREVTLGAYGHQDLPFEKLVEELQPERNLSHNPLFQVMFALQNTPTMGASSDSAAQSLAAHLNGKQITTDTAKFDLSLFMMEKEWGLAGEIEYNVDLFDASTIDRIIKHYQRVLEQVAHAPQQCLAELSLLSAEERQQLLVQWNNTGAPLPKTPVPQMFEAQVERTPSAVAVISEQEQVSYQELNRRANQVAHYLRRAGVGAEVRVGVCMERGVEMVVGILGILKAGGAYVPLDPGYPAERLAFMMKDAQIQVLLTQQHLLNALPRHETVTICYDTECERIALEPEDSVVNEVGEENLSYVIYTSGSTGRPKGVAMSHRSLVNLIHWQINTFAHTSGWRTLQFAAFSFDVSFQEVFSTLCSGGVLVLTTEQVRRDSEKLLHYLNEMNVGRIFLPPVAFQQLAETSVKQVIRPSSVREVIMAGEQLKVAGPVRAFLAKAKCDTVRNQYGPTESHVVTELILHGHTHDWPTFPSIGKPIANARIYILDSNLQLVPIGVAGQLHIGGVGIARGYLNRPALTAEKFIPDPFSEEPGARLYKSGDLARLLPDGNIEFLGRVDHQLKIRGFRVEPGEVEAAIEKHPAIRQAVVIAKENVTSDRQLVAYVVCLPEQTFTVSEMNHFLREFLPEYMIPSAFVELNELPLSPNGKVDRQSLPTPEGSRPKLEEDFVAPRNSIEETIAGIWREILGLKQVGIYDNFFDLGGHSLMATQVISRLRNAFQVESLPLRRLFETPIIAELVTAVVQFQVEQEDEEEMRQILDRLEQLTDDEVKAMLPERAA